jgi:hypothetical protein
MLLGGGAVACLLGFAMVKAWPRTQVAAVLTTALAYPYALLVLVTGAADWWLPQQMAHRAVAILAVAAVTGMATALGCSLKASPSLGRLIAITAWSAFLAGAVLVTSVSWRTPWTGAVAVMVALWAVTVAATRRADVATVPRVLAAACVVPALTLALVNLGAVAMAGSAAQYLFPAAAALGGLAALVATRLARPMAAAVQVGSAAVAGGAGLIGAVWPTTGAYSSAVTCFIITLAAAGLAVIPRGVKAAWYAAFAGACGTLWSLLAAWQVTQPEAYLIPPALATVAIAALRVKHRPGWVAGAWVGLAVAIVPTWLLAAAGQDWLVRCPALVAGAAVALGAAQLLPRLRLPLAWGGAFAATGGVTAAILLAKAPPLGLARQPEATFAGATAASLLAASLLAWAWAVLGAPRRRYGWWWLTPALVAAAMGPLCAVQQNWWVIGAMWLITAAYLVAAGMAARAWANRLPGPNPYLLWGIAVATGIGGWSPRQLRVEAFSVPLGVGLLVVGLVALRAGRLGPSAAVIPGLAATLGPSVLAIGTDPLTFRAIGALTGAVAFLLVGAAKRWKAVMFTAVGAMAAAVLAAFTHTSRGIATAPWLLALALGGVVLLVLAIYTERGRRLKP